MSKTLPCEAPKLDRHCCMMFSINQHYLPGLQPAWGSACIHVILSLIFSDADSDLPLHQPWLFFQRLLGSKPISAILCLCQHWSASIESSEKITVTFRPRASPSLSFTSLDMTRGYGGAPNKTPQEAGTQYQHVPPCEQRPRAALGHKPTFSQLRWCLMWHWINSEHRSKWTGKIHHSKCSRELQWEDLADAQGLIKKGDAAPPMLLWANLPCTSQQLLSKWV